MNEAIAAEILEDYNRWRRGDDSIPAPDPEQIGQAIDTAVRALWFFDGFKRPN